jgi:hypothetical protein
MAMKPSSAMGMAKKPSPSPKPFVPALTNGVRPPAATDAEKKAQYDYQMKSDARKAALMKGLKRK